MAKPISVAYTFQTQVGPIPLAELDLDIANAYAAINDFATYSNYVTDTSGAANVITVTTPVGTTFAYAAGVALQVQIGHTTTTTAVTINVNSLGAKAVVNADGSLPAVGQFIAGQVLALQFDGTAFRSLNDASIAQLAPILGLGQTPAEAAAGVTPVNLQILPGFPDRYQTNTTPGTTDMSAGLQAAVNQMLQAGGSPVRFIQYVAYNIVTPPTFGATTINMQKIDIGCNGGWTQIINSAAANKATFDLTGRAGADLHDLLLTGNSSNPNDGVRIGTIGAGGSTQIRVRNVIAQMAGHAVYGADCNTCLLDNVTAWPDNPPALPVAQSVTASTVLDHIYFEGGFAHDITIYRCRAQPNTSYSSTGGGVNRGIKVVPSTAYNFRVRDCLLQGENGSNTLIGLQLGNISSNIESAIVDGNFHENSFFQFNNVGNSSIKGNTNGNAGGGFVFQLNSQNNAIEANFEKPGTLSFDSSSGGNRYDPNGFATITDNATVPNIRAGQISISAAGGQLNNNVAYGPSMTPNLLLGKRIRVVVTDAVNWTLNNPTNLTLGDIVQVAVINNTAGAIGVGTFGSAYKLASATPTMPGTLKQRCWLLAYDGTNLTVVGNEPTADTGF